MSAYKRSEYFRRARLQHYSRNSEQIAANLRHKMPNIERVHVRDLKTRFYKRINECKSLIFCVKPN